MFDNRLEITSPGGMYDGSFVQDRDIGKIPSRRRNPIIADIFHRLRYMERRGSGFNKICEDYKKQYLYTNEKAPQFYSDEYTFILTLSNLNYTNVCKKGIEKNTKRDTEITRRNEKILELIIENPQITQTEMAEKLHITRRKVQTSIKILTDNGYIERIGSNKNGSWKVNDVDIL